MHFVGFSFAAALTNYSLSMVGVCVPPFPIIRSIELYKNFFFEQAREKKF